MYHKLKYFWKFLHVLIQKEKINNHTRCFIGVKINFIYNSIQFNSYNIFRLHCSLNPIKFSISVCLQCVFIDQFPHCTRCVVWLMTHLRTEQKTPPPRPQGFATPQLKRAWGFRHGYIELLPHFVWLFNIYHCPDFLGWITVIEMVPYRFEFFLFCWTINGIILMIKPGLPLNETLLNLTIWVCPHGNWSKCLQFFSPMVCNSTDSYSIEKRVWSFINSAKF